MYFQSDDIPSAVAPRRICDSCGKTAVATATQRYHNFEMVVGSVLYECLSCEGWVRLGIPTHHYKNCGDPKYAPKPSILTRLINYLGIGRRTGP